MKRLLLASALLALSAFAASAADMAYKAPPPAPIKSINWTGWYVGFNVGYGNNYGDTTIVGNDVVANAVVATGAVPGTMNAQQSGWLGGGQIGYNWQYSQFLFGIETDLQFADIKGSASNVLTTGPLGFPASLTSLTSTNLDWFGTLRGRAGFLVSDRALIYATGGLAYGKVEHAASATLLTPIPGLNAAAIGNVSDTKTGWALGGGIEYALLPNITLRAEYMYLDFGNTGVTYNTGIAGIPISFSSNQDLTYHVVRGGMNFRF